MSIFIRTWNFIRSHIACNLLVLLSIPFYQACENDIKTVGLFSRIDTLPVESVKEIQVIQSDSGRITFILTSQQLNRYEGNDPYMEFPKGFKIIFYDSAMQIKSQLTADYGVSFERRKIMEAKNNVEVINYQKNEKLNTEHLVWDQKKKLIYSDVFVKITSPDKTIFGENGLEADEQFNSYTLKKAKGEIRFDQDKY
ncbi:MAG: LPS export ABC transporter periplasmic protein LptC [Bacteroidetes bacterium]|nr:LPS export ABC transporter periplasmic protein LptC [Bacteroidota bacterium]